MSERLRWSKWCDSEAFFGPCGTHCQDRDSGVDESVIQRILHHSNVAITQACYVKTASEDAKTAMRRLETTALNDTYVDTQKAQFSHEGGHVMHEARAMQLFLLDGFGRNTGGEAGIRA